MLTLHLLHINLQNRNFRRGYPCDSGGLSQIFRTHQIQLLSCLQTQTLYGFIIQLHRQKAALQLFELLHLLQLLVDIACIFYPDIDLLLHILRQIGAIGVDFRQCFQA